MNKLRDLPRGKSPSIVPILTLMLVFPLLSILFQSSSSQLFPSSLFSAFPSQRSSQNNIFGLESPLRGNNIDLLSLFNRPTEQKEFESINDYDDQIVHSRSSRFGHISKGARHWAPFNAASHSNTHKQTVHYHGTNTYLGAPRVKNVAVTAAGDYDESIDREREREEERPSSQHRSSVFSSHSSSVPLAPLIRAPTSNRESVDMDDWTNLESEISSFSTVHQTADGNYRNVQKIMSAFKNLLVDPNKPKKIVMSDDSEIGMNRDLAGQLFESDIVLTVPQMKGIVLAEKEEMEGRRRHKRKVITGAVYRWPNPSSIPYRFKDEDPEWKRHIVEGLKLWERETCLRFHENYGQRDHILFYKGSGCFSSVGKTGGSQMISIGKGCQTTGIVAHELAHSMGFWHEQSRPDRDYYIRIRREFVASGSETNFLKSSYQEADSMGLPYDLGSIMHYGPEAFSSRGEEITMETVNARYQSTIGQRIAPSFIDIKQMNRLYCNDACRGMQLACLHGGYPDPNDCQLCKCPDGLGGPICNEIQGDCGSELVAGRGWQQLTHTGKGDCAWRIRTTNGKIKMRLSRVDFECKRTCENFVEVKSADDLQLTGFRTCCPEEWSVVSEGNEVLVLVKSSSRRVNSMKIDFVRVNSLTELVDKREMEADFKAPAIRKWVPGQEDRGFRGVDNGPVEKFILNSIGSLRQHSSPSSRLLDFFKRGGK